jgi:hypothetical protein
MLWALATLDYHPGRQRLSSLEARTRTFVQANRADTKTLYLLAWGLAVLKEEKTPFFGKAHVLSASYLDDALLPLR